MDFKKNTSPIYLQIAETICDSVMNGFLKDGDRIPSVREYAASMAVNPNTVMRTYEHLSQQDIIVNRRGIGFFVTENAKTIILKSRQTNFLGNEINDFFRQLSMLGITPDELANRYTQYLKIK